MARCGEMWRDVARCGEMWRDVARCGEMWGDVADALPHALLVVVAELAQLGAELEAEDRVGAEGRHAEEVAEQGELLPVGEIGGDAGRCGEMWGEMGRGGVSRLLSASGESTCLKCDMTCSVSSRDRRSPAPAAGARREKHLSPDLPRSPLSPQISPAGDESLRVATTRATRIAAALDCTPHISPHLPTSPHISRCSGLHSPQTPRQVSRSLPRTPASPRRWPAPALPA